MRSIYITWFYKHNQTYEQKDKLAKQMRHSVNTAGKNYLKVFNEETESEPEKIQDVNIELEKEIGDMKDENIKLKQKRQD